MHPSKNIPRLHQATSEKPRLRPSTIVAYIDIYQHTYMYIENRARWLYRSVGFTSCCRMSWAREQLLQRENRGSRHDCTDTLCACPYPAMHVRFSVFIRRGKRSWGGPGNYGQDRPQVLLAGPVLQVCYGLRSG